METNRRDQRNKEKGIEGTDNPENANNITDDGGDRNKWNNHHHAREMEDQGARFANGSDIARVLVKWILFVMDAESEDT